MICTFLTVALFISPAPVDRPADNPVPHPVSREDAGALVPDPFRVPDNPSSPKRRRRRKKK